MFQLRKKPLLLQRRGICAVFECSSNHWTIAYRILTAYYSRLEARLHLRAGSKLPPCDNIILSFLTFFVNKKRGW